MGGAPGRKTGKRPKTVGETSAEVWRRAARLTDVAEVRGLRATSIVARDTDPPDPDGQATPESEVDTVIGVRYDYAAGADRVVYEVGFRIEVPPTRTAPGLLVHVVYRVLVRVPGDVVFDAAELNAYGASTVLLNTYPYFREVCQSLTARLGRPPLMMGVMTKPLHDRHLDDGGPSQVFS